MATDFIIFAWDCLHGDEGDEIAMKRESNPEEVGNLLRSVRTLKLSWRCSPPFVSRRPSWFYLPPSNSSFNSIATRSSGLTCCSWQ